MHNALENAIARETEAIVAEVRHVGFALRSSDAMRRIFSGRALADWRAFASSWDHLGLDTYMADGGRYRRRRFAAFQLAAGEVARKPHQPHYQSRDYNPLHGGVERWFSPVLDDVIANRFCREIVGICAAIFEASSRGSEEVTLWHMEMHQFRIEAVGGQAGSPTPEGPHRDGVDFVCVLLVARHNVSEGVTQIFDPAGRSLGEFTLTNPLDAVFLDDRRVFHGVTPIGVTEPQTRGWRDVLVLTFRQDRS